MPGDGARAHRGDRFDRADPGDMAFLGMIFYSQEPLPEPPWLSCVGIALAWAFVIMNTDRILLATYRPFQPWCRRILQVCFRFVLAGVVSVAIAFPFCLDQYRPAIRHRYQTEIRQLLDTLRGRRTAGRKALREGLRKSAPTARRRADSCANSAARAALTAKLPICRRRSESRDLRGSSEWRRAAQGGRSGVRRRRRAARRATVLAQIDAQKETLAKTNAELEEKQDLHRRLVEAIAREALGQPNEFYPEIKKVRRRSAPQGHAGARSRSRSPRSASSKPPTGRRQEALVASDKTTGRARLADKNAYLDALVAEREAFVAEGEEKERIRKERLRK